MFKKWTAILIGAAMLASCATPQDNTPRYTTPGVKSSAQQLEVPPDLNPASSRGYYDDGGSIRASQYNKIKSQADDVRVLPTVKNMHIEREGSIRWLVIDGKSPQEVWPLLQVFWQENGFVIAKNEPEIGYMETQWAENQNAIPQDFIRNFLTNIGLGGIYSSNMRDKFITRIERGRNGATLVTFAHKGMTEKFGKDGNTSKWTPRPSDPNLEAQMLARFMLRIGADENLVRQEMGQSQHNQAFEARIDRGALIIAGDHERNIHRLRLALDRVGLTPLNYDAQMGFFIVRPQLESSQEKLGFFDKMMGKKPRPVVRKPDMKVGIRPLQGGNGDSIVILDDMGRPAPRNVADKYLNLLWKELR